MHFGKQGHGHFGHPIVVLDDTAGWKRVLTCRNVVGWIRTGSLTDTVSFVRGILRELAGRMWQAFETRRRQLR
jgi:hypothetical protein